MARSCFSRDPERHRHLYISFSKNIQPKSRIGVILAEAVSPVKREHPRPKPGVTNERAAASTIDAVLAEPAIDTVLHGLLTGGHVEVSKTMLIVIPPHWEQGFADQTLVHTRVSEGYLADLLFSDLGNDLAGLALEASGHQELPEILLRQIFLGFAIWLAGLIVDLVKVTGRIRCQKLVDEKYAATTGLAELELRVNKDHEGLLGLLGSQLEKLQADGSHLVILDLGTETAVDDRLWRDVLIMLAYISFGRRGDDRARELVILLEPIRQSNATDAAHAFLVGPPSATTQVTAYDHLDLEWCAIHTNRNLWVRYAMLK